MTKTNQLNRVIKIVSSKYKSTNRNEKVIIIDYKNAKTLNKKPLLSLGKDLRYYSVITDRNIFCEGPVCNLRNIEKKHSLNIKIDFEICCLKGNEEKLVTAIYDKESPKIAIEECIEKWIYNFNKDRRNDKVDLISSFYDELPSIKEDITNKALAELGIELQPFISVQGSENLKPITGQSEYFPIRVNDYDNDINIKYEFRLELLDNNNKINAILNYYLLPDLKSLIKNKIENFLIKECSLHEFCFEFNNKIKPTIIERINTAIEIHGRRISYIKFDLQIDDILIPESPLIPHRSKYTIKDTPIPIEVDNSVLMDLVNIGLYKRAAIEDLEKWIKNKLDKITQEIFFDYSRLRLLNKIKDVKKNIEQKLQKECSKIGYNIKYLTSLPNMDELSLKQGFKVKSQTSFKTRDSRMKIKVDIAINGKLLEFEGMDEHLINGVDEFKNKIITTSEDIIDQEIREIHPVDIFKSAFEGENSIDNQLKKQVTEKLIEVYNLSDIRVSILFQENIISKRIRELKAEFPNFHLDVIPDKTGIRIPYQITYQILGVEKEGYDTFHNNTSKFKNIEAEISKINESLKEGILKLTKDIPGKLLLNTNSKGLVELEKKFIKPTMHEVANKVFGLILGKILVRRLETDVQLAMIEKNKEVLELGMKTDLEIATKKKDMLIKSLTILQEQEEIFLRNDERKSAKKIRKQIEELTEKTNDYMDQYSQMQNLIQSPEHIIEKDTLSLEEFIEEQLEKEEKTSNIEITNSEDYDNE